jgi:hypothetical protein
VARHIFQACPVWIYTQSNITQASYSPEYITPTQQILGKCSLKTCMQVLVVPPCINSVCIAGRGEEHAFFTCCLAGYIAFI